MIPPDVFTPIVTLVAGFAFAMVIAIGSEYDR